MGRFARFSSYWRKAGAASLLGALACTYAAALGPSEVQSGWINLLDDASLYGWTAGASSGAHVDRGVLTLQAANDAVVRSNFALADFQLICEYRLTGSAKVYLRESPQGKHRFAVDLSASAPGWSSLTLTADGTHLEGSADGKAQSDTGAAEIASGYLAFELQPGAHLEVRKLVAHPLNLNATFNGSNLDGWAMMKPKPDPAQGSHKFLKVLPLPSGKKNEEKTSWTVQTGALHGEKGPGQIHTDAAYDNIVLQFQYSGRHRGSKSDTELILRADPNRLADGYKFPLSEQSKVPPGSIIGLHAARSTSSQADPIDETIVINNRHIDVWVGGRLVNDYEDPRPGGPDLTKEARVGAAPIAVASLDDGAFVDIRNFQLASLKGEQPKVAKVQKPDAAAPVQQPAPITAPLQSTPQAPASAGPPPQDAALSQLLQAQNKQQEQQQRVGSLMQQALATSDPKTQVGLYDQILTLDPANQAAFAGRKEALGKLEAQNAAESMKEQLSSKQAEKAQQQTQSEQAAFEEARMAFLRGDLNTAQSHIATAQRLSPSDPNVLRLANLITSRIHQRNNILYMLSGGGVAGLSGIAYYLFRRRKQKTPWLCLVEGNRVAKEFALKSQVTRIGAIPNDGSLQNDIVLTDRDRSISRFHCELHSVKNRIYVVDCDSANGTYVNGQRVRPQKPALVKRGNQIRLGYAQTLQLTYKEQAS